MLYLLKYNSYKMNNIRIIRIILDIYCEAVMDGKLCKMFDLNLTSNYNSSIMNYTIVNDNKAAFTLAEVLITLGIIGVVAALTIPNLVANYQKKLLINQNKQAYSLIINALNKIKSDSPSFSYVSSEIFAPSTSQDQALTLFSKYFKTTKLRVGTYRIKKMRPGESHDDANKYDDGEEMPSTNLQTANGMIIGLLKFTYAGCIRIGEVYIYNPDGTIARDENGNPLTEPSERETCADIFIDVNGKKDPNQYGKDVFRFSVLREKYELSSTAKMGNIDYIIKHNDFDPNIIDYELGGDKQ